MGRLPESCRIHRDCLLCKGKGPCLWIGYQARYPCRDGWDDVEDEFVTFPVPNTTMECPMQVNTSTVGSAATTPENVSNLYYVWTILPFALIVAFLIMVKPYLQRCYNKFSNQRGERNEWIALETLDRKEEGNTTGRTQNSLI